MQPVNLELPVGKFPIRRDGPYKHLRRIQRAAWCRPCEKDYWKYHPRSAFHRLAHNLRKKGGKFRKQELVDTLGDPEYCYLCGEPFEARDVELDHVVPLYHGGPTSLDNPRWSHRDRNRAKGRLLLDEFLLRSVKAPSFRLEEDPDLVFKDFHVVRALQ